MPMAEEKFWYLLVDRNKTYAQPCGYCRHYKRYLSVGLMRTHRCESRQCSYLSKMNHEYWEEKKKRKERAKERRKQLEDHL